MATARLGTAPKRQRRGKCPPPVGLDGNLQGGQISATRLGVAVHEIVAAILDAGKRWPTLDEVMVAVAQHSLGYGSISERSTARHRLLGPVACYFRCFEPDFDWSYIGSFVETHGAEFDLVWRHDDGRVRADELKTGRLAPDSTLLAEQLGRELEAGRAHYSEVFCGVRACVLPAPYDSFLATPDGRRTPLFA